MRQTITENVSKCWSHSSTFLLMVLSAFIVSLLFISPLSAHAEEVLKSNKLLIKTGEHGEISSIKIVGDEFPTEYAMNKISSPEQDTDDHQWIGELIFTYRLNGGEWIKAWTNKSADARTITRTGDNEVTVTYENASDPEGIRNFKVIQKYTMQNDGDLLWSISVENTSGRELEIGDFGLPLPFNEQWTSGGAIYEERVVTHSYVGKNSSYITAGRPSGIGSYLMLIPDAATDAGFEYQDRWRDEEHPGSKWAWNPVNEGKWIKGLNVFYIHSEVIKATNRGYLDNTSLKLAAGESKQYGFKLVAVKNEHDAKDQLYGHDLLDVTVVPGMIVPRNQTAKFDLRTKQNITKVTDETGRIIPLVEEKSGDHHIYEFKLNKLGEQHVTVEYGEGHTAVLQFYVIDSIDKALADHSTFMVEKTQWNLPGDLRDKVFDDWMMNTKSKRNNFAGYWGWGDDWGLTHGQFLAEKNALTPVKSEVEAVDQYLETAIWNGLMQGHHEDYLIHDFLMEEPNTTPTYRGYAYPHVYNTFFSMYKIADLYPNLTDYINPKETYLLRAYNIFKTLYEGPVAYNWETGLMGELTTPELIAALEKEGYVDEANDIKAKMVRKYNNFKNTKYPYGSEYSYDNTGEEAVYTLAKMQLGDSAEHNKALEMMSKISMKTRASRGHMPVWYYYADPVTITGENWWNFQYSVSLAGYAMDDWIRYHGEEQREVEQRMSYAAKIANISAINSGQISDDPENYGAAAWTYQAEKGNQGTNGTGGGRNVPLLNGWKGMTGEADLGLFGALKILSADVAIDPIFGVTGYGANVSVTDSGNYHITPTDGLFKRLNLITEQLYIELEKDQYTEAKLSTNKDYVWLAMKNLTPGNDHSTTITFKGLKQGAYLIKVDGNPVGKLNAFGEEAKLTVAAGAAVAYTIELTATDPDENMAPIVNAGEDFSFTLPDDGQLRGSASDDGLPNGTLTTKWSVVQTPENGEATFKHSESLFTTVSVNVPGEYTFKLTVSDSELTTEDEVTVTVYEAPPLPELLLHYAFDETEGTIASDQSGNGKNGSVHGNTTWNDGKLNHAISLGGQDGYVKLPEGIVSRAEEVTISTWVKANKLTDYSRIFDFGSGTNEYMFLSTKIGSGLRFSITTGGNSPGREQSISGPALTEGGWTHVAVTIKGNTGTLYVNGAPVGKNENLTINPTHLGKTKNNFIGKSQYSDPYFDGMIDDFRIYSRALSDAEIAALVAPVGEIVSVEEVSVTTTAEVAPKLPPTVRATLADGSNTVITVQWESIDPVKYANEGNTFEVDGTIVGTDITVTAHVTVLARDIALFPSLLLRYNFDEASGTDVNDTSGHNHHGVIQGELTWDAEGHKDSALTFGGSSGNYVNVGSDQALQPKSLTLSYWIKRTQNMNDKENVLLWFKPQGNYSGNGFFVTYNGNSSIMFVDGANGFYVKQSPNEFLPLNEWTHVVVTFDGNSKTPAIYKNGEPQELGFEGTPASITATSDLKKIGVSGYSDGAQLNAGLDDFRIYDGVMTAAQVKAMYEDHDIQSIETITQTTHILTPPVLPSQVKVTYENGSTGTAYVIWDDIDPMKYAEIGQFTVNGRVDGTALPAQAIVDVIEAPNESGIVSLQEVKVSTTVGVKPTLPEAVQATYKDGSHRQVPVVWGNIAPEQYATSGVFEVQGNVEGTELRAKAIITVKTQTPSGPSQPSTPEPSNPSPSAPSGGSTLPPTTSNSAVKQIGKDFFKQKDSATTEVHVKLEQQQNAVSLPVGVSELLENRSLVITSDAASVTLPSNLFKSIASQVSATDLEKAHIIVKLAKTASSQLTQNNNSSLKQAGDSYELSIAIDSGNGKQQLVDKFKDKVKIVLPYQHDGANVNLLGAYKLNVTSGTISISGTHDTQYYGGTINKELHQITVELQASGVFAVLSYDKSFTDVPSNHWVYDALKQLTAKHIVTGMTDTQFNPQGKTTRAEFTVMLAKALGLQAEEKSGTATPFNDVSDAWYTDYVTAAYQAGLIQGVSADRFEPNAGITREQMAVLLLKAYEYKAGTVTSGGNGLEGVTDQAQISPWAQESIDKVISIGLMKGKSGRAFDPKSQATRAQTVQAIHNFIALLK